MAAQAIRAAAIKNAWTTELLPHRPDEFVTKRLGQAHRPPTEVEQVDEIWRPNAYRHSQSSGQPWALE